VLSRACPVLRLGRGGLLFRSKRADQHSSVTINLSFVSPRRV
jgi:hypothetical protein